MDAVLSEHLGFRNVEWDGVPDTPGAYAINDRDEVIYVGMAGRNAHGSLRRRLRDHASGQMVNMFVQYVFLNRVQFLSDERITQPNDAKIACRSYIRANCSFRYRIAANAVEARSLEASLKLKLKPTFNPG